jgi:hypothetical protein
MQKLERYFLIIWTCKVSWAFSFFKWLHNNLIDYMQSNNFNNLKLFIYVYTSSIQITIHNVDIRWNNVASISVGTCLGWPFEMQTTWPWDFGSVENWGNWKSIILKSTTTNFTQSMTESRVSPTSVSQLLKLLFNKIIILKGISFRYSI